MKKIVHILMLFICVHANSQSEVENFKYFSAGYSEKGTEWVSYRLTSDMVDGDTVRVREHFRPFNGFKTTDYRRTGYDRGHLAAADSFSFDQEAYSDTFSLANIVPMVPDLNRQVWKWLEVYEKKLALKKKCINVRINVIYSDMKIKNLHIPEKFVRIIKHCDGRLLGEYEFLNLKQ